MSTALIVSATEDAKTGELLREIGAEKVVFVRSGGEARRMLGVVDYDLIIINAPLPDENGIDLAVTAAENTLAGILLLVKNSLVDVIISRVENAGIGILGKPVPSTEVIRMLKLLKSVHLRFMGMKKENKLLKNKIEEMKQVDRAKLVLIDSLHMTENQAHKYIEKQAMDLRITRKAVAERILRTYEL